MRAATKIPGLLALLLLAGCAPKRVPGLPVPLRTFVLRDVQGLYGGHALWAAEDRTATVQVVGRPPAGQSGLWEKRYKIQLTAEQWAEAERLVGVHNFLSLKIPKRRAVPDEAHPIIAVITTGGETAKVLKWAKDRNPDFDPLYRYLLHLCRGDGELIHEGAFDWKWRPDGFEQP